MHVFGLKYDKHQHNTKKALTSDFWLLHCSCPGYGVDSHDQGCGCDCDYDFYNEMSGGHHKYHCRLVLVNDYHDDADDARNCDSWSGGTGHCDHDYHGVCYERSGGLCSDY